MTTAAPPPPAGDDSPDHDALPAGTRFGELEILRVIGVGGFGIVYLAQDHALERTVALKEYMPGSLARRGDDQQVSMRSGAHEETYALGLRSFVNEARLLARFNHPSLVKVYRFWEANGTAYMVMPYLQGRTLRETRRAMSEPPTEAWIRALLDPLLGALALLHREDVFHRDIAPDNILLPPAEPPVLLDFGAARQAISGQTQTFTAILKPSYAPIEQYAEVVRLRQGPWTDLYALGAVVHYLLRGTPPPPATSRAVVEDDAPLLAPADCPTMSPAFVHAVEWMLAIRPSDRPQSIEALREVLEGRAEVPPRGRPGVTLPPAPLRAPAARAYDETQIDEGGAAPSTAAHIELEPAAEPRTLVMPRERTQAPPANTPAAPAPRRRMALWIATLAVAGVAVGFGAWYAGSRLAPPMAVAPADEPPTADVEDVKDTVPDRSAVATAPAAEAASGVPSDAPGPLGALAPKPAPKPAAATAQSDERSAPAAAPVVRAPADRPAVPPAAPVTGEPPRPSEPVIEPRRAAPPPAAVTPAAATAAAGPAGPEEACGSRVFLALALCMERECAKPRFRNHPECVPVREMQQRQRSPGPY